MTIRDLYAGGAVAALAVAFGPPAWAQEDAAEVEEVVVTGSFIAGTPEDAALPVDVISADELQRQGSPSTTELIRALPTATGSLGQTNQFDPRSQGAEGAATVNLRGLGASRTLVLFNGRRLVQAPIGAGAPDVNLLPTAAIGRIEVLKEGAAATYGSDAIGGVVNFITRRNFDGVEINAYYEHVPDADGGEYGGHIVWGWAGERMNVLASASYQHRSELSARERSFTNPGYFILPEAWSTAGNPTAFVPVLQTGTGAFTPAAAARRDVGCVPLGGQPTFLATGTPVCAFNFNPFANLVERQDQYQLYAEVNYDLTDTTTLHLEGLYAHTEIPEWATSPSYLALNTPTGATNPILANPGSSPLIQTGFFVPAANPGFALYRQQNPGEIPAFATGAYFPGGLFRPLGVGGNPIFGGQGSQGSREHEGWRVSGSIKGEFGDDIGYEAALTYMTNNLVRTGYDVLTSRLQLALRGLGGPGCNPGTGTPGQGACRWFNPFSNAIASNVVTGQTNPAFNAAVANDPELVRWLFEPTVADLTSRILVADLVFNGRLGWELGGGQIGWAAGLQYRKNWFESEYDQLTNLNLTPCVDTPITGSTACATPTGPFTFLGGSFPSDLEGRAYAAFAELNLPFTDRFEAQLAARYEDYGDEGGGSTFDPKLALRFQATDILALRAAVGTTFRAPPLSAVDPGQVTTLQPLGGQFRGVVVAGNPGLEPESAFQYSIGAILEAGDFNATIDYWSFDFDNPIITEPVGGIFSAVFPESGPNNCANPAFAALLTRFTFQGPCAVANISTIRTGWVNGPKITTSGVDVLANYRIRDLWGGDARLGGNVTFVRDYTVEATTVEGVVVSPAFQGVNQLNFQTQIVPVPQWKAQAFAEYERDIHNVRLQLNYVDSYIDPRTSLFAPNTLLTATGQPVMQSNAGQKIDSWLTADLVYRVRLPWDTTAVLAINNITDEPPPFARLELGYDPFTGDPVGRTFKLSVTKRF